MQLQAAKKRFEAQGLKLAAVSYDSPAILKDFAERHSIDLPLLADPRSEIIRSYQVLNAEAKGMTKGMAHPGFFYIDENGVIREKYFELKYTNRFTANNVIGRLFPELTEGVCQNIEAPHLRLTLTQSDRAVAPGSRATFEGKFRITQDVTVTPSETRDVVRSLVGAQKTISIAGELKYQVCDTAICYPPTSVPLKWQLQVVALDLKRSPKAIRHN